MKVKRHLTLEGVQEIMAIKVSMNNGLSSPRERAVQHVPFGTAQDNELKTAFLNSIIPVERPLVLDQEIKDPH